MNVSFKIKLLSYTLLIWCIVSISCRHRKNQNGNEGFTKLDSQRRAEVVKEYSEMTEDCDEAVVKKNFLEWMDSYYPDWPVKGKIKIFDAESDERYIHACAYNIRFQVMDPHTATKEIVVVRLQYKTDYTGFKITPVRGILY